MYRIGICDDEENFIVYFKNLILENMQEDKIIFLEYRTGEELLQERDGCPLDLLFLDVKLPGMDGNVVAKKFREKYPKTILVFVSGVYAPTVTNFEVSPYRYLLKEYTEERMKQELLPILCKMKSRQNMPALYGKCENVLVRVELADIYYIDKARRCCKLHGKTEEKTVSYEGKLEELAAKLSSYGFSYAHNSYLVNLEHVVKVETKELELDNGITLSLARSKKNEFRQSFVRLLSSKYEEL